MWIARDRTGDVYLHKEKPIFSRGEWFSNSEESLSLECFEVVDLDDPATFALKVSKAIRKLSGAGVSSEFVFGPDSFRIHFGGNLIWITPWGITISVGDWEQPITKKFLRRFVEWADLPGVAFGAICGNAE